MDHYLEQLEYTSKQFKNLFQKIVVDNQHFIKSFKLNLIENLEEYLNIKNLLNFFDLNKIVLKLKKFCQDSFIPLDFNKLF